jgi:hypothetical protein
MWVEVILSGEDLKELFAELMPLTIHFGHKDQYLSFNDLREITLVPDTGLRIACKAKVCWPLLGLALPIPLHSLVVLARPEVAQTPEGDILVFKLFIEHADFAGIPTAIDERITDKVNKALSERALDLSWNFARTLSRTVKLPRSLRPLDALSLRLAWGKVRVTDEAMVMAVSFHSKLSREGAGEVALAHPDQPQPEEEPTTPERPSDASSGPFGLSGPALLVAGGAAALAGYAMARVISRPSPSIPHSSGSPLLRTVGTLALTGLAVGFAARAVHRLLSPARLTPPSAARP